MTGTILKTFSAQLPDEAGSETDPVEVGKFALMAVRIHSAPVASSLTFKVGNNGSSMDVLKKADGSTVTLTLGSTKPGVYTLDANDFAGFQYITVVSGETETSVIDLTLFGYEV